MRRISILMALAGLLAAAGCSGGSKSGSSGTPGGSEQNFQVKINQPPVGGTVASSDAAQISCGASSMTVVGTAPNQTYSWGYYGSGATLTNKCSGTYAWTSTSTAVAVTLSATPASGYVFVGWAGDCKGSGPCDLKGPADRMVVAIFAKQGEQGHVNFLDPASAHATAYNTRSLACGRCHGESYQGQGIAPRCDLCHAMPAFQGVAPVLTVTSAGSVTDSLVQVSVAAADPDALENISCSAAFLSQPSGSAAALVGGAATDCRAALKTVSFTPVLAGSYVVRVTVSDGVTAPVVRDVTIAVTAAPVGLPTVSFASAGAVTESPVALTLSAVDPVVTKVISCTVEVVTQPRFSAVVLSGGAAADCRAAAQLASFTPAFPGSYVVRATVADGGATPVVRDVTVDVASKYTGGAVTGVGPIADTLTGTVDRLRLDIALIPAYGTGATAAIVYRTLANISPAVPPTNGSASTQGAPVAWASRPFDIIDVRDAANFAAGHIPGALNVPMEQLPGVLLAQPWFPNASNVGAKAALVVGYSTGDSSLGAIMVTAGRASTGNGVPVNPANTYFTPGSVNFLSNGMATWTYDKAAVPFRWSDDLGTYRFEFKLTDSGPGGNYLESGGTWTGYLATQPTYGHPTLSDFSGDLAITNTAVVPAMKRVLVRLREWTAWAKADNAAHGRIPAEAFVANWGFYKQLRDAGEPYHELTRQSVTEWAVARTVGALRGDDIVNNSGVVTQANFKYLDPNREMLVNCFTNGSAVRPCFVLTVLGYKARSVLYGIGGLLDWGIVGAGSTGGNGFNDIATLQDSGSGGNDLPISKSDSDPQSLAWTQPAAAGCRECHTDYGKLYTITGLQASAPVPEVLSEGEG